MAVSRGVVRKRASRIIRDSWQSQANLSFFLILLVMISLVLPTLGVGRDDLRIYADLGFSVMLVSGVALAWGLPTLFWIAASIGLAALVIRWVNWWQGTITTQLLSDWGSIAASAVIIVVLLAQIFRTGRVTHVRIQGAIAAYLLLGGAYAHGYHIVEILHPGSFTLPPSGMLSATDWSYFSFVTLTTVGYGDITPVLPIARTLAIGEALSGQLYLAVMVARLVAMEIVFWQQDATGNPQG
jgi:ion channel